MNIVAIGGRIKSASVGLNNLYVSEDVYELDEHLRKLRDKPPRELLEAFFPSDFGRLKQMMRGIGFYRPILKTDQGMAGNFLPFKIDLTTATTDLSVKTIQRREGVAIPEAYCDHDQKIVSAIQRSFHTFEFETVDLMLQSINGSREALKGRGPFFFIQPAITNQEIVVGCDIADKVNKAVNSYLEAIREKAIEMEKHYCGVFQDANLLYCQPDVFILSDGTVIVEKINCPDVGLFLNVLNDSYSSILPPIKNIVQKLHKAVCSAIIGNVDTTKRIAILTRDEVLKSKEDILEIKEIESIRQGLQFQGIEVDVYSLSMIDEIPMGREVILLNLDYRAEHINHLFDRHQRQEIKCYPNPFFQLASQKANGLSQIIIPSEFHNRFIQLIDSRPKDEAALRQVWKRLDQLLCMYGIKSDILHVDIGYEIVPIFRRVVHSWQQLARRIKRYNENGKKEMTIKIMEIPASPANLLITSSTGPRLHAFRFMCTKT